MDVEEALELFCEYVLLEGSDEAASTVMDADAGWDEIDQDEMYVLLMEFGDDYGWNTCRLATMGIYGTDGS